MGVWLPSSDLLCTVYYMLELGFFGGGGGGEVDKKLHYN